MSVVTRFAPAPTGRLHVEYKRRLAHPGIKRGKRNFGRDRRRPIGNAFQTGKP